jgi:formylmethanofuran dehydrogenase subunit E
MTLTCTKCGTKLTKKRARLIEGKVMCSKCLFPEMKKGVPQ